jgi:hypothetical protein
MYADTSCYYSYDGDDLKRYSTHLYKDAAVTIIENHDFSQNPLFLYLAFQAVHEPFVDVEESFEDGVPSDYLDSSVYNLIKKTYKVASLRR